jgi:guanylate cyclase soluble subunit beta
MYGWVNESVKALVISKFGVEIWEKILEKAKINKSDEWLRYESYSDSSTYDLVAAASEVLGLEQSKVLEVYGAFFIHFVKSAGYATLLECLGSDLRSWLSNVNKIHDHLRVALPQIRAPNFM